MQTIDAAYFDEHFCPRNTYGNKYTFGSILIYAGSPGKWGAAVLASLAALRTGSGLVTALMDESKSAIFLECCPEVMHLYSFDLSAIQRFDAIGMGSGLGKETQKLNHFETLLEKYDHPMVLDADALNMLSDNEHLKAKLSVHHILTPHFGEASRLFGRKVTVANAIDLGLAFVKQYPCILVLKGPQTKVITPTLEVYENTSGNDSLATAGSGDVLMGIITSFLGKGYKPVEAACLGVYIHGLLADRCILHQSKSSLIASDLIEELKCYEL